MRISYDSISDIGCIRKLNQDMAMVNGTPVRDGAVSGSVLVPGEKACLGAIVCDGVGGHANGEVAAEMVCLSFREFVKGLDSAQDDNAILLELKQWFREVNNRVIEHGDGVLMCTTLTGMLICGDRAFIMNAGDSRTYRLRYDDFRRLTSDHSERERTGDMSVPASRIYNCVGLATGFLDVKRLKIVAGDRYLICSDGLSGFVAEEILKDRLADSGDLLKEAIMAGGPDNITFIILNISN